MAKGAGPPASTEDTTKVRNWWVPNSQIVQILMLLALKKVPLNKNTCKYSRWQNKVLVPYSYTVHILWLELYVRYDRRVMNPNTERNFFRYNILCIFTLVTRKLQVVCWRSTYRMTALLSEMSIFCVRAGCQVWMVRYASKHALQSLSSYRISLNKRPLWINACLA